MGNESPINLLTANPHKKGLLCYKVKLALIIMNKSKPGKR